MRMVPHSHRATVMLRTPNALASFPWLRPHLVRQSLNSLFVMLTLYTISI
jgi:hypothetical protein